MMTSLFFLRWMRRKNDNNHPHGYQQKSLTHRFTADRINSTNAHLCSQTCVVISPNTAHTDPLTLDGINHDLIVLISRRIANANIESLLSKYAFLLHNEHLQSLWNSHSCHHYSLQWRQHERDGVSNHRRLDCLLGRLFKHRSTKTSNSDNVKLWYILLFYALC